MHDFGSTARPGRRYLLVSPCRDEAEHIRKTLDTVAAQTVPPARWIVVDDGSKDETPAILSEYAARLPYLTVVRREDRGARKVGPGVIEAFYAGLEQVDLDSFDYLCKLDGDLELPPHYFELLMDRMERDPRLGTTSGKPYMVLPSGRLEPEVCGDEMSVGMSKFYRLACFREIGGFVRQVMWDGIDCHRARMLGWRAESVDEVPLRFIHLRPQGASHKGIFTGRVRAGFGQWYMGTSALYYAAVAARRIASYPPFLGSLGLLWGYGKSAISGAPRYEDPEFRRFVRRFQYLSLLLGKKRATTVVERERGSQWTSGKKAPFVTGGQIA